MSPLRDSLSAFRGRIMAWRRGELGGLAGDSGYAAVWIGASSLAGLIQIALITHALGLTEYGRFAVVVSFVTLVAEFFDVRVGVAATTLGAQELQRDSQRAAGVFQLTYLIDAVTGVIGFAVVIPLAFVVGPGLVGDNGTLLIVLYAITILAATVDGSSQAALRLLDRFRLMATYTVGLEVARVGLIVGALLISQTLVAVILALLAQKVLAAVVQVVTTAVAFRAAKGRALFGESALKAVVDLRRRMLTTVLHTNIVSYGRLAQTQLPTIVLGAIAGPAQAGLYKVGMAASAIVGRLAEPAYVSTLPRLSRLFAAGRKGEVKRLIERASLISVPVMVVVLGVVILLRDPILSVLGGNEATDAAPVLAAGATAYAINGALFWNIGVLFAAGRARSVAAIAIVTALMQAALLVPLVVAFDATGAALAYLVTMALTNLVATVLAIRVTARGSDSGSALPDSLAPRPAE
jgi:O-antigen/teichoic acid export membrane protein